ncbi:hypothetical protein [Legionella sp. CNM-4043-24]|uniref:hypothetical protein n=1 Tax=Legionella sp. CNM-4043-24 TaxID=3421646 RepID=UPI00403B2ADE
MYHYSEIKLILDAWFEKSARQELQVYGDQLDPESGEPALFLKIRRTNAGLYRIQFADDQTGRWSLLNEKSLNRHHLSIALLSDSIKKHNERSIRRRQTIGLIIGSVAFGLYVAAIVASAVFSGGVTLGLGVALGIALGAGATGTLLSWFGFKEAKKWLHKNLETETLPKGTYEHKAHPKTWLEIILTPFSLLNAGLKWLTRTFILDSVISKFILGNAIAVVANRGNPHYRTEAQAVTKTLATLIFPAGLQSPKIHRDGRIYLGPVLGRHHRLLRAFHSENEGFQFKPFKVRVKHGVVLDGVEASNGVDRDENALHVLYFNGNSGCYEENNHVIAGDLKAWADEGKAVKAVQFNYPGILRSTGQVTFAQDLIDAGIAQVERLNKQQGIPYHKIGLHGVSLGGSIASHVASYYHSRGIELAGTYLSKTFSSTTNVAVSYVHKLPFVGGILGFLLRPLIVFGLWGTRWQLDTAGHFSNLPRDNRDYSVVRSGKLMRALYAPKDDPVLAHYASLHESWHLRLQRFFHKRGWFSYDKSSYAQVNHGHKMSVFEDTDDNDLPVFSPKICGHSSEDQPGVRLYHRHTGEHPHFGQVLFPPTGNEQEKTENVVHRGMASRQRIQFFFSQRQPAVRHEDHDDSDNEASASLSSASAMG